MITIFPFGYFLREDCGIVFALLLFSRCPSGKNGATVSQVLALRFSEQEVAGFFPGLANILSEDSHCIRILSFLTAMHWIEDGYMGEQRISTHCHILTH